VTKHSSKSGSEPLALTVGEPAGIGPDLVLRLASRPRETPWIAVGDIRVLAERARKLQISINLHVFRGKAPTEAGELAVLDVPNDVDVEAGTLDRRNARSVLRMLDQAIDGCLNGSFAGMVTAPVQKSVINDAGIRFSGHTEYLQEATGADDVVMMLASPHLRVALATTHLPLREVPDAIQQELLERRLRILNESLQTRFRVPSPRILVAGLNPHAGEGGHLGREEIEVINPVLAKLRTEGFHLLGPLPADSLFVPRFLSAADAVMAMYHDQGLPVLKASGFGEAVNITLGLPFVRTSVDHGTALDLAGTGKGDPGSLAAAIDRAAEMIR
jgi:4-hydroxythreonine-4-phosphate dehydrogenase